MKTYFGLIPFKRLNALLLVHFQGHFKVLVLTFQALNHLGPEELQDHLLPFNPGSGSAHVDPETRPAVTADWTVLVLVIMIVISGRRTTEMPASAWGYNCEP